MNEHRGNLVTTAVVGVILILGAGAGYVLTQAGPETLATTSRTLLTVGLIGLAAAAVVAMHLTLTSRHRGDGQSRGGRGGYGWGDDRPQPHDPAPTMDDLESELYRIIRDEQRRDARRGRTC